MTVSIQNNLLRRFFRGRNSAEKQFLAGAISPLVLYMTFWTIFPLLWGIALAFFDYSPRQTGGFLGFGEGNPFVGLQHFESMLNFTADAPLEVQQFHIGIRVTLLFAVLVVPLNLLVTLPLAFLIESINDKVKGIFRTLFFLPVLAPSVGVAIMWGFIFHPQRGLLNAIIGEFTGKLVGVAWLRDSSLTVWGIPVALFAIVVAYLWQDMGYNLVIFIAALQGIPQSIKDAARIDGANWWQMFARIIVPLLMPTILLAAVLTMISAFQVFDIVQVMTDGGPDDQTQVLLLNIYSYAFRYQKMGWAAAVSIVMFLLVFSISFVQTRLLRTEWEY
ncbi:MAG TPA: sugar ABC transporter permease [Anaerolineales bacterium]|nr:sugar ABC transporter permease [Anaerolineales bacterium]